MAVAVGVGKDVAVAVKDGIGVAVAVGVSKDVAVAVEDGIGVAVAVGNGVPVAVGTGEGVDVGVIVGATSLSTIVIVVLTGEPSAAALGWLSTT